MKRKEKIKLWVDALRSGNYIQDKGKLHTLDNKFCCLGVLCDVLTKLYPEKLQVYKNTVFEYSTDGKNWSDVTLPRWVKNWIGFSSDGGKYEFERSLWNDNDVKNLSFNRIAEIIDSKPKGLFRSHKKGKLL